MQARGGVSVGAHSEAGRGSTSGGQRAALILLGCVIALVLLEGGLRATGAVWLWARERRHAGSLAGGDAIRVLCLGESTTALGGANSYPRQLERILNRDGGGRRFSVVNGGVPGITTEALLARLEQQLDRYRPDIVVTMIGTNDDLVARDDVHRLPRFGALRVVKLTRLLIQALRAKLGGAAVQRGAAHPVVAQAVGALAAGRVDEAQATLRASASAPDPSPDVVDAFIVVLTGAGRFGEARAVATSWLENHPNDAAMQELLWRVELNRAAVAIEERRLDDAEAVLAALRRTLPPGAHRARAIILARRVAIAELRGDHAAADRHRAAAERLRTGTWNASSERNYRELVRIVRGRGVRVIAMQYPLRSVAELRALLGDPRDVELVENDAPFRDALRRAPWETWFTDAFAGDFGHTTPAGSRLLAESAARAILAEPPR